MTNWAGAKVLRTKTLTKPCKVKVDFQVPDFTGHLDTKSRHSNTISSLFDQETHLRSHFSCGALASLP